MTGPRDWDKELADIDRVIAKDGAAPSNAPMATRTSDARQVPASSAGSPVARTSRLHLVNVWARTLLGIAGAAALPFWPYSKTCGTYLYLYMVGAAAVAAAGLWTMRGAWTHRRGVAHIGGLLVFLAGSVFLAIEILHRTTFAAVHLSWTCP